MVGLCLLVTFVSPAKTAEPIEMLFGMLTQVDPRNHVLDGYADLSRGMVSSSGKKWRPIVKYRDTIVSCAKTAEPVKMPNEVLTQVG